MEAYWRVYKTGRPSTSPSGWFPTTVCMRAMRASWCHFWSPTPSHQSPKFILARFKFFPRLEELEPIEFT